MEHVFNSMFPSDPKDRQRFLKNLPLQVFSCWNGMAILKSKPFGEGVKFRSANETLGECAASECQILARDFWAKGFGRIFLSSSININ
jgi:alpha-1,3-mannosyltransferase